MFYSLDIFYIYFKCAGEHLSVEPSRNLSSTLLYYYYYYYYCYR